MEWTPLTGLVVLSLAPSPAARMATSQCSWFRVSERSTLHPPPRAHRQSCEPRSTTKRANKRDRKHHGTDRPSVLDCLTSGVIANALQTPAHVARRTSISRHKPEITLGSRCRTRPFVTFGGVIVRTLGPSGLKVWWSNV